MESDDLGPEKIITGGDVWNGDGVDASVLDQPVDGKATVKAVLIDLDPAIAGCACSSGSNVDEDWALMGWINDVVLGACRVVMPFEAELWKSVIWLLADCYAQARPTLSPALTESVLETGEFLTLQIMSLEVTSTSGELFGGARMYPAAESPRP